MKSVSVRHRDPFPQVDSLEVVRSPSREFRLKYLHRSPGEQRPLGIEGGKEGICLNEVRQTKCVTRKNMRKEGSS